MRQSNVKAVRRQVKKQSHALYVEFIRSTLEMPITRRVSVAWQILTGGRAATQYTIALAAVAALAAAALLGFALAA